MYFLRDILKPKVNLRANITFRTIMIKLVIVSPLLLVMVMRWNSSDSLSTATSSRRFGGSTANWTRKAIRIGFLDRASSSKASLNIDTESFNTSQSATATTATSSTTRRNCRAKMDSLIYHQQRLLIRRQNYETKRSSSSNSNLPLVVRIRLECQTEPFLLCVQRRRRRRLVLRSKFESEPVDDIKDDSAIVPECLNVVVSEQEQVRNAIVVEQQRYDHRNAVNLKDEDGSLIQISIDIVNVTQRLINALYLEVRIMEAQPTQNHNKGLPERTNFSDVLKELKKVIDFLTSVSGVVRVIVSDDYTSTGTTTSSTARGTIQKRKGNNNQQRKIEHVRWSSSTSSAFYNASVLNDTHPFQRIGIDVAHREYCASGENVRIAVLDTGIDYTHKLLGGPGTVESYQKSVNRNNLTNRYFPNDVVVDGYDFIGEITEASIVEKTITDNSTNETQMLTGVIAHSDPNPIDDVGGHGTSVAHIVHTIAPNALIIAVKVCSSSASLCPDFAIIQGLEYILDPNYDGSLSDRADIVNLSLGEWYSSPYYSVIAQAIDNVFAFGVLPIVAAGNHGNIPYIIGSASGNPNSLTVGATLATASSSIKGSPVAAATNNGIVTVPIMAAYSSRGPTSDLTYSVIKPDLVAPGGPYELARSGTGDEYKVQQGTSFATPIVAGCAALLLEKCRTCTPFAIKALLMNRANRNVLYNRNGMLLANNTSSVSESKNDNPFNRSSSSSGNDNSSSINTNDDDDRSPVSLSGSGELQIENAFRGTFWVYSLQDMNPSMSLGIINAAESILTITRTLRIVPIPGSPSETVVVSISTDFRNKTQELLGAVRVTYEPSIIVLHRGTDVAKANATSDSMMSPCNNSTSTENSTRGTSYHDVNVTFTVYGALAPVNRMSHSGKDALDPSRLDFQEFDGWIVLTANVTDYQYNDTAVVPFHMILRKAASVFIQTAKFESFANTIGNVSSTENNNVRENINNIRNNSTGNESRKDDSILYGNEYRIDLNNNGTGIAQIDFYELIHVSKDDMEPNRGSNDSPADIRFVGYRIIPVAVNESIGDGSCSYLLEFAITLWEGKTTLSTLNFIIYIDVDNDESFDFFLYNASPIYGYAQYPECRLYNITSDEELCTNYPPDDATNTANTVLRVCSDDLGIVKNNVANKSLNILIRTISFPDPSISDETGTMKIMFPEAALSSPSLDVLPGGVLQSIQVFGSGILPDNKSALGLLLFTNGFRDNERTGAATAGTETLVISRNETLIYPQVTNDKLIYSQDKDIVGPTCSWFELQQICIDAKRLRVRRASNQKNLQFFFPDFLNDDTQEILADSASRNATDALVCSLVSVPRPKLGTQIPNKIYTLPPTLRQSNLPTSFSVQPTLAPESIQMSAKPLSTTVPPTNSVPRIPSSKSKPCLNDYIALVVPTSIALGVLWLDFVSF